MTERYWICVYNDRSEGIRGVAGAGSGEARDDVSLLLSEGDILCQVFNPDLAPGMWILAGSVVVTNKARSESELDYRKDEYSPAPDWRRLEADEIDAISKGETPRRMAGWLAKQAWA